MFGSPWNRGGVRRPLVMDHGSRRLTAPSPLQRQPFWRPRAEAPPRWRGWVPHEVGAYPPSSSKASSASAGSSTYCSMPSMMFYSAPSASGVHFSPPSASAGSSAYYSMPSTSTVYYSASSPPPLARTLTLDLPSQSSPSPPLASPCSPPWSSTRTHQAWTSTVHGPGEHHRHQQLQQGLGRMGQELLQQLRPSSAVSCSRAQSAQRLQQQEPALPSFGVRTAAAHAASTAGSRHSSQSSGSSRGPDDHQFPVENHASSMQQLCIGLPETAASQQSVVCQEGIPTVGPLLPKNQSKITKQSHKSGLAYCVFCKGNNELPQQYLSHVLHQKRPDGSIVVTCEVLRSLKCDVCGATGDLAHTRSHCPFSNEPSIALLLKRTPRRCDGSLRYGRRHAFRQ